MGFEVRSYEFFERVSWGEFVGREVCSNKLAVFRAGPGETLLGFKRLI